MIYLQPSDQLCWTELAYILGGLGDDINNAHIYHREETELQASILSSVGSVMSVCSLLMDVLNPASFFLRNFLLSVMY